MEETKLLFIKNLFRSWQNIFYNKIEWFNELELNNDKAQGLLRYVTNKFYRYRDPTLCYICEM